MIGQYLHDHFNFFLSLNGCPAHIRQKSFKSCCGLGDLIDSDSGPADNEYLNTSKDGSSSEAFNDSSNADHVKENDQNSTSKNRHTYSIDELLWYAQWDGNMDNLPLKELLQLIKILNLAIENQFDMRRTTLISWAINTNPDFRDPVGTHLFWEKTQVLRRDSRRYSELLRSIFCTLLYLVIILQFARLGLSVYVANLPDEQECPEASGIEQECPEASGIEHSCSETDDGSAQERSETDDGSAQERSETDDGSAQESVEMREGSGSVNLFSKFDYLWVWLFSHNYDSDPSNSNCLEFVHTGEEYGCYLNVGWSQSIEEVLEVQTSEPMDEDMNSIEGLEDFVYFEEELFSDKSDSEDGLILKTSMILKTDQRNNLILVLKTSMILKTRLF